MGQKLFRDVIFFHGMLRYCDFKCKFELHLKTQNYNGFNDGIMIKRIDGEIAT